MSEDVILWLVLALLALLVVGIPGSLTFMWLAFHLRGDLWLVVQLSGAEAPYPARPVRGLLRVTSDRITFGAFWARGRLDLTGTGLQALYERPVTQRDRADRSVVVVCRDGRGTSVSLRVYPTFVGRVVTVLADRPLPPAPQPPTLRPSRWAIAWGSARQAGAPPVPVPSAVPVRPRDATWEHVSASAAAASVAEAWASGPPATSEVGTGVTDARPRKPWTGRAPVGLASVAVSLLVGGFLLWPLLVPPWASYSTLWGDVGETSRTVATIVARQRTIPLLDAGNVTVEVVASEGVVRTAVVPMTTLPDKDEVMIAVEYPVDSPGRAWAVEGDGRVLTAAVGGVGLLLLVVYAAAASSRMARAGLARRASLRSGTRERMRYVVVLNELGRYLLLLFGETPGSLPRFGVALHEGAVRGLPVAGILEMHGDLREGAEAVPVVQDRPLATVSPLALVGPEQALQLFERFGEVGRHGAR